MSASTQLQTLLLATPAVTALCGTRIASDRMEQGAATPFVVYTGTAEPQRALDGSVHGIKTTFEITRPVCSQPGVGYFSIRRTAFGSVRSKCSANQS